jgi:hypothetical protein
LGRFILVKNNSGDVVKVLELRRANYNRMVQNLLWTTVYNVVALPWQLIFWLHSEQVSQKGPFLIPFAFHFRSPLIFCPNLVLMKE